MAARFIVFLDESHILHVRAGASRDEGHIHAPRMESARTLAIYVDKCYIFAFTVDKKKRNAADFRERTLTRTIPLFKIQQDSFDSPLSAGGYVAVLMNSLLPIGRLPVTTYSPPLTYENAANLLALRLSLFGPSAERGWLHYLLCEGD